MNWLTKSTGMTITTESIQKRLEDITSNIGDISVLEESYGQDAYLSETSDRGLESLVHYSPHKN